MTKNTTPNTVEELDLKEVSYEIFTLGLSAVAVFNAVVIELNLVNTVNQTVLSAINLVLSIFFLLDFLMRFYRAESRSNYFLREFGWADLLSGIPNPAFQVFRLVRLVRSSIHLRSLGGRKVLREISRNRAAGALYFAIFLALMLIEVASVSIIAVEASNPDANITTASDALWWSYVTITTVGYGDRYPVTNAGRVVGVFVMTVGVGLFGVLTGFLANKFLGATDDEDDAAPDTVVIAGPQAADTDTSLAQLASLQTLLAEQEKNVAQIREQLTALDVQLRARDDQSPAA